MEDAAVAIAILGFAVGMMFRLKVLVVIVVLLLAVSILSSIARGFTFVETTLMIVTTQSIVQASYFLGLVARAVFAAALRARPIL
jgi:hypothetical protein